MFGTQRRLKVLGLIAIVGLAVAVCMAVPGAGKRPASLKRTLNNLPKPAKAGPSGPHAMKTQWPFKVANGRAHLGSANAKVKIAAYIHGMGGCGDETARILYGIAKANSSKLYIDVVNLDSAEGQKQAGPAGMSCAGLKIDGKQQYDLPDKTGAPRKVNFHANLGDGYREDDLYAVLDLRFKQAYGTTCTRAPHTAPKVPAPAPSAAVPGKAAVKSAAPTAAPTAAQPQPAPSPAATSTGALAPPKQPQPATAPASASGAPR